MKRTSTRNYLIKLRTVLEKRFNEGELRTLCFDLSIDYENLPGSGKADRARELVAYCERRNRIHELGAAIVRCRPDISIDAVHTDRRSASFDTRSFFRRVIASPTRISKITDTQFYYYLAVGLTGAIVGLASIIIPMLLAGGPPTNAETDVEIYLFTGFLGALIASVVLPIYADVKLIQTDTFWRRLPPAALFGIAGGWVGGIVGLLIPCLLVVGFFVLIWWIGDKLF